MRKEHWVAILAALVLASPLARAAQPAAPPRPAHWSDRLKNIPLGPFHLDVGGSVRFRYEHQNDFNQQRYADDRRPGLRSDGFLLRRERLDFTLRMGEEARLFVQVQDAYAHGSDFGKDDFPLGCPYWNPFDLRQAYLEWRHIGGTPFGIKIGRQAIHYGDNRIWGPGEWGNVGRYTWDAAKLIIDTDVAEVHGIFANRVAYDPHSFDEHDSHLDAYGVYAMVKALPFALDLFWIGQKTRPDQTLLPDGTRADLDTHSVGFRVDAKLGRDGRWDTGGTLVHTFGDHTTLRPAPAPRGRQQDVDAWGANARLGYTFDAPWQPRIGAEYSYASGDSNAADGDFETFDGGFGAVDKMYGRMNLFAWKNLHDYQVSLSAKPHQKLKVALDWHLFRLDEAGDAWYYCSGRPQRRDPTGDAGKGLGQEIDLIVTYKHSQHLEFMGGYAHFFAGSFVERTGPSPDADWFFLQTQYSF